MNAPLASIVVCAYNAQDYLERALACAAGQTEGNIQIVVVDDGSTDNTWQLAQAAAAADARIKLVRHACNQGRLEARRSGIVAADAPFTTFLDADDELAPEAIRTCLDAQAGGFDIVQFSFDVAYERDVAPDVRERDLASFAAPVVEAHGEGVAHVTFRDRLGSWNLCGKLIRTSLLARAQSYVANTRLDAAEDACLYFIASCLANSFKGLPDARFYLYNMDAGGTDATWSDASLERFGQINRYSQAIACARAFMDAENAWSVHGSDFAALKRWHIHTVALRLLDLPAPLRADAFDAMADAWGATESLAALEEVIWGTTRTKLEGLGEARSLTPPDQAAQAGALALYNAGSALFTTLDEGAAVRTVDPPERGWPDSFAAHARSLSEALAACNATHLILEDTDPHFAPWDALVAYACGAGASLVDSGATLETWDAMAEHCCAAEELAEQRARKRGTFARIAHALTRFMRTT